MFKIRSVDIESHGFSTCYRKGWMPGRCKPARKAKGGEKKLVTKATYFESHEHSAKEKHSGHSSTSLAFAFFLGGEKGVESQQQK